MKIAARACILLSALPALLAGCVYAPVMQTSQPLQQHPGVFVEVWSQVDGYGRAYSSTSVANRSSTPKCAWTEFHESRLLRPGETWQLGAVQAPVSVVVTNVMPWDPNCVNARREHGGR